MVKTNLEKFKELLAELFMFDQADLDFGIYRIMNAKRAEITRFLDNDLLPQVKETLSQLETGNRAQLKTELDKATQAASIAGISPEASPKVRELQEQYSRALDLTALENEVFSHLYNFFRRYYHEGDFLSLRRYKAGVYAIPYEGEEVKLHWANADQYYIKSSENFRDYTFKLPDDRRVHFKLVTADTEQNNNKAASGQERRFILSETEPLLVENGELFIRFEYRPDSEKRKQAELNAAAGQRILQAKGFAAWMGALAKPAPTEKNPNRTLLDKHLAEYTARNTFDYFIHKDLGGFLRRELDFFIKNEVMHLDDVESETAPRVEQYLGKIKAIRRIAHKIIAFLEQLENFQKKLWLKKKFVVETNYCVTLDRVPEALYPEIAANEAQREEWVRLFSIDEIEGDLVKPAYSVPLTVEFLKANPFLVLDTSFFSQHFQNNLLMNYNDLDATQNGILICSENFHALVLWAESIVNKIKFIYLDPPYNTGADEGFVYKDSYQESSWHALMFDRLTLAHNLLSSDGTLAISIDLKELGSLIQLLDMIFGRDNRKTIVTIQRGSVTGPKVINPGVVNVSEYVVIYAKDSKQWSPRPAFREKERDSRYSGFIKNRDDVPNKWEFISLLDAFASQHGVEKKKLRSTFGVDFDILLDQFVIQNANAVYQLANLDESKISSEAKTIKEQSIAQPERIFHLKREGYDDWYIKAGKRILFYSDRLIRVGERLAPGELLTDIWEDVLPNDIHNEGGVTLRKGKKPEKLIQRLIQLFTVKGDLVLDFFLGSGTSCAVCQKMGRRWIGVELSSYFRELPLTRLKNTLHGESSGISEEENWKGGGFFRFLSLESYEDALNNLELKRKQDQTSLLEQHADFREDYVLRYMLEVESRDSASLLNLERFEEPFNYQLKIANGGSGETKLESVDLVETFNYLLGLRVKHIDSIRGFRIIEGANPSGEKVLVIWRNTKEKSNADLDAFFQKQGYNTRDREFDLVYVNGDNNLENLKRPDETWKVRLIEEEFKRLMFETLDV